MSLVNCDLFMYDISQCGIYEKREKNEKYLSLKKLLKEIKQWAIDSDKPLVETSTFSSNTVRLPVYCFGIEEYQGTYLFALWNSVPHSKHGIAKVNGTKAPSKITIDHGKINKGEIPGYPTYYWFVPEKKKVIALKINNTILGISALTSYFMGYLTGFSSHHIEYKSDGKTYFGFSDKKSEKPDELRTVNSLLGARFSIKATQKKGDIDKFLNNSNEITKLVKDIYVYNNLTDNNAGVLLKLRTLFNNLDAISKKKVRVQMPVKATREQISDLISLYIESEYSEEHDVGFVFKGNSTHIEWLSGSIQQEKVQLNITWIADEQPDLKLLIQNLHHHIDLIENVEETVEDEDVA